MTAPTTQLLFNQSVVAAEKHKFHFFAHPQTVAIFSFESRAGQHRVFPCGDRPIDLLAQTFQPRPSVCVRQPRKLSGLRIFSTFAEG